MNIINSQLSTIHSPLRSGYKQTEVGVIPEEWGAVPLKEKVDIAHGFAFASEHFASHGPYRLATPGHFYEAGGFRDIGEKQKYYVGPVPSDYVLQPGDVIVAMTERADGLLGSAAVIPEEEGYLHNQRLGRVTVLSSEIQLDYLVYVFNSPSYHTKVGETAAGSPQNQRELTSLARTQSRNYDGFASSRLFLQTKPVRRLAVLSSERATTSGAGDT